MCFFPQFSSSCLSKKIEAHGSHLSYLFSWFRVFSYYFVCTFFSTVRIPIVMCSHVRVLHTAHTHTHTYTYDEADIIENGARSLISIRIFHIDCYENWERTLFSFHFFWHLFISCAWNFSYPFSTSFRLTQSTVPSA